MGLTISQKLLIAFLGLTLLVLTATLGLARWSFERGFLDYVNALEQRRLEGIADDLADYYVQAGSSWSTLNGRVFDSLLRRRAPPKPRPRPERREPRPPRPPGAESAFTNPPPRPPGGRSMRPPPEFLPGPPTALFNPVGELLAGSTLRGQSSRWIKVPITIEGQLVAELATQQRRGLSLPLETQFSKQQLNASIVIGVAATALALLVSLTISKLLLAPVRRMILGVKRLSDGDYSSRISTQSRDELGKLMVDLDRLAASLDENQTARNRWLADISHELRTPVSILSGEIESLQDGVRELNLKAIQSLNEEVTRIRHLIDDLYELSLSDIGGLRYRFENIDLIDCINNSIAMLHDTAKKKGITVDLVSNKRVSVNADSQRLNQLFLNLISNSLAYTDVPGQLVISVDTIGNQIQIQLQDTTPGITKDECKKIFEPLYRRDESRNRRTAGAGLGLAICRNIVDAHGGTITAKQSAMGGVLINILLPLTDETQL